MSGSGQKRVCELREDGSQGSCYGTSAKRNRLEDISSAFRGRPRHLSHDSLLACNVESQGSPSGESPTECSQISLELPKIRTLPSRYSSLREMGLHCDATGAGGLSREKEEICFGMLKDVQIGLTSVRDKRSLYFDEVIGRGGDIFVSLNLDIQKDWCAILTKEIPIAMMNSKTHLALVSLSNTESLRWTGIVPRPELHQKLASATKPGATKSSKVTCMMSVFIFGPRSVAETLARELSRYRMFLQHPYPMPTNVLYDNPQYLNLMGSSFSNGALLPPLSAEVFERDTNGFNESDQDEGVDIAAIMDNLPKNDHLEEAEVDGSVTTELLSHQKEAVDFIIRREASQDVGHESLWRLERLGYGAPVYKHIITGLNSREPADILGGILADGMGLGKTLTMIASIVTGMSRSANIPIERLLEHQEVSKSMLPVKSTLVILPSVLLLDGWIEEIEKHVMPNALRCYKYHGSSRSISISSSLPYDIVLSTYSTVAADFRRGGGVLNRFHWYRLVLDEAHVVRNSSTQQFKAIASLSASVRWCMTGTPIQNSLDDLASLIKLLRVPLLDDSVSFRRHISGKSNRAGRLPKPNYTNLKLLLGSLCLRRNIANVLPSLGGTFVEHRPSFSISERRAYNELARSCGELIRAAVNAPPGRKGNRSILSAVLRLRIFCNTGPMNCIPDGSDAELQSDEVVSLFQQSGEAICSECKSEVFAAEGCSVGEDSSSSGGSLKCQDCARPTLGVHCRASYSQQESLDVLSPVDDGNNDKMEDVRVDKIVYPSKLLALLADIREHYSEDKSIVFSFWRRSLDLVGSMFNEEGIVFQRVDGTMDISQRKNALTEFYDNSAVRVLLMTIGTGAVGLNNLSVANRVHILEPQWNPSAEDQAIGRALRLGQEKPVFVIRYIMKQTVEESIESRQISKVQLSLRGGLQSSHHHHERISRLQKLGSIIEATVCTKDIGGM